MSKLVGQLKHFSSAPTVLVKLASQSKSLAAFLRSNIALGEAQKKYFLLQKIDKS